MRVFRAPPSAADRPIALTIGNFDGVHLGHQAMLARVKHAARERGLPAAAMTFEPHPREFFAPHSAPARLVSLREKLELLAEHGLDRVYVCRFNARFAATPAREFVTEILGRRLATRWLLVGDDFQFGAGRAGNHALLVAMARDMRLELETQPTVELGGKRVSSTLIREALGNGDLAAAQRYLGRAYFMSGRVVHGDKLGRKLGFPTANVRMHHNRPPLDGVFAVKLRLREGCTYAGVASLGTRPTVKANSAPTLEVYVFDFSGDLYGQHVHVEFLHKLRDQAHYPDLATLTAQIERDAADARRYFARLDA